MIPFRRFCADTVYYHATQKNAEEALRHCDYERLQEIQLCLAKACQNREAKAETAKIAPAASTMQGPAGASVA